MDVERTLLGKAISTAKLPDVVSRGIEADHFADPDCRDVYEWSMDFFDQHGDTPPLKVIRQEFPGFKIPLSKAPLSYHMEQFIKWAKERKAVELVRGFHDAIEDPDRVADIEVEAIEMARELSEVVPSPRAFRFSDKQRIKEYDRRREQGIIHGMFMGVPTFDNLTLGIQPHELVVIAAYFGTGKSMLMAYMAYMAYLQGKTCLFISLEMEAEALLRRIDVMATNVRYHALKALELDLGEREQWERLLEKASEDKHERDIIIRDDMARNCTADRVMAEAWRYKPDVVFVDYLELMKTPRAYNSSSWENIKHNGEQLKHNAMQQKIAHVTAAQLNREGGKGEVTLANVSYQSIGKIADLLIGMSQEEEQQARQLMKLILLKNRDGPRDETLMRWMLERMDIGESGIEERFPKRKGAPSLIGPERRKAQRLEVARNTGGQDNPWAKKRKRGDTHDRKKIKSKARAS